MWQWKTTCRPGNPSPSEVAYIRGDALADCTAARPACEAIRAMKLAHPVLVLHGRFGSGAVNG